MNTTPQENEPLQNDVAELQTCSLQLEEALAEYAEKFGLTDKAREAFKKSSGFHLQNPAHDEQRR